jgi:large subunit ribosomal protein L13
VVVSWSAGPEARFEPGHLSIVTNEDENVKTYTPKASEIERAWHVVDAEGLVLGRMATEVARILRGKHKPTFAPHMDTGDHVIIINADKVVLTNDKAADKMMYRHSGYPGGIRSTTYADMLATKPADAVRGSVRGMLPKNRLGRQVLTKLKVYAGPEHPHTAQKPQPLALEQARAREAS